MTSPDCTTPAKRCIHCNAEYPATADYFHRDNSKASGLRAYCKLCANSRAANYFATHKEQCAAKKRVYNAAHTEENREYGRRYNATHKEERTAYRKRHYSENRDYILQRQQAYNKAHRRERTEYERDYRTRNIDHIREVRRAYESSPAGRARSKTERAKESKRASLRRYKAIKRQADGAHTADDIRAQLKRQKNRCYWCNSRIQGAYDVDHVIPLSRGGSNGPENLVIACPSCNRRKSNKLPHEWDGNGGRMF